MEVKLKELFGEDMHETGRQGGEITFSKFLKGTAFNLGLNDLVGCQSFSFSSSRGESADEHISEHHQRTDCHTE